MDKRGQRDVHENWVTVLKMVENSMFQYCWVSVWFLVIFLVKETGWDYRYDWRLVCSLVNNSILYDSLNCNSNIYLLCFPWAPKKLLSWIKVLCSWNVIYVKQIPVLGWWVFHFGVVGFWFVLVFFRFIVNANIQKAQLNRLGPL